MTEYDEFLVARAKAVAELSHFGGPLNARSRETLERMVTAAYTRGYMDATQKRLTDLLG